VAHPVSAGQTNPDSTLRGGVQVLCPSAGVGGPLYNVNPVAINLLQLKLQGGGYLIPSSGAPDTAANLGYLTTTVSDPVRFKDHMGLGNFDWIINNKHTLAGRFEYEADPMKAPIAVLNATLVTQALLGSPVSTVKADHQAVLRLTSTISNNLVNEARISYQRFVTTGNPLTPFRNSQVGIADMGPSVDLLSILVRTKYPGYMGSTRFAPALKLGAFKSTTARPGIPSAR
jgi:hypothetical protein